MNNIRKTNVFSLLIVGIFFGVSFLLNAVPVLKKVDGTIWLNGFLVLAVLLFCLALRKNPISFVGFRKISLKTLILITVMTFLGMPFITFVNYISMIFSSNVVASEITQSVGENVVIALLSIAVLPALVEEIVYRGAILSGYREEDVSFKKIVASAFLFAALHMNFNQMSYAFVLGMLMAVLVELTGSIWSSIWMHFCINGSSVLSAWQLKMSGEDIAQVTEKGMEELMESPLNTLLILAPVAAVSLVLIIVFVYWIAKTCGTTRTIGDWFFGRREERMVDENGIPIYKRTRYVDVCYVLAVGFCLVVAIGVELS